MHLSDVEIVPWSSPSGLHTTRYEADLVDTACAFEKLRPRLFGIAFQTLGRTADAEDVVQDAWIRWQCADRVQVRDGVAFLVTITTRVALNAATSARARREIGVAESIPARDDTFVDPAAEAERTEALATAVQLLIARLSPLERAVYVLREAFEYPFREIAEVLAITEANARQLSYRARRHLAEQRQDPVEPARRDGLLAAFLDAGRTGDMAPLIDLLTAAVVSRAVAARRTGGSDRPLVA
jgi:RNA polymerase sigma-70 factor (ECF subfamily)